MEERYDVFISYARVDSVRARLIRDKLGALGLRVFFDTEGIDTGEEFPVIIDRAVKGARCVVGLWSRAAFNGRWVRIESRIGLDQNKLVAGVLDGMLPEELPAEFYNVNVESLADFRGQDEHPGWQRMLRTIGKRVGRDDLGGAAASASPQATRTMPSPTELLARAKEINPLYMVGGALAFFVVVALTNMLNPRPDTPADRFSGNRVFTPSEAAASTTEGPDLTGTWSGSFREGGREAPFEVELRADGAGGYVGQVEEPNVFAMSGAQTLHADIRGQAHADGSVSFTKSYNGAGGYSHSVQYEGRIDDGGRTITGTWRTAAQQGAFSMARR